MTSGSHAWRRGILIWDAFFALVLIGTLVLIAVSPQPAIMRALGAAALLAAAVSYALIGRRVAWQDRGGRLRLGYLILLVGLIVTAQSLAPAASWSLFAVCPLVYTIGPLRRAVLAVVVLNIAPLVAVLGSPRLTTQDLLITGGIATVSLTFSVAYGTWMTRIIAQSTERAELIAALEQTQGELAEISREAGTLAERQRLAGEIHDTIAQGLTSIVTLLQAAETELDPDPEQARRHLSLAISTARESLAEARAMVTGLAPEHLAGATLPDALGRLAERISAELAIAASFDVAGAERPLPPATEVVLLRCGQEALANVRKHAAASRVTMRLDYGAPGGAGGAIEVIGTGRAGEAIEAGGSGVRLEVADDGRGFDTAEVNGGFGLRGMRDRLERAGGRLAVRSAPGAGTELTVEVPE